MAGGRLGLAWLGTICENVRKAWFIFLEDLGISALGLGVFFSLDTKADVRSDSGKIGGKLRCRLLRGPTEYGNG